MLGQDIWWHRVLYGWGLCRQRVASELRSYRQAASAAAGALRRDCGSVPGRCGPQGEHTRAESRSPSPCARS